MQPNTTKDCFALFVHDFTGSEGTWNSFPTLLANNPALASIPIPMAARATARLARNANGN